MRKAVETEQERTRRLDQIIRSLVAENRIDAERSAELQEALAPFAESEVPGPVQEILDTRFATESAPVQATVDPRVSTTASFIRA